jgi:6-pyruvoyltetrahydropterin/6-carboxytetrahydropterin synthase
MYELSITARFSAAHHLKGYVGTCAAPHGHNWEVRVFVRGSRLNETGILMDFRTLKQEVDRVIKRLDHTDLSELGLFEGNPTSENIARFLFRELSASVRGENCEISRVSVQETPGTEASYWEP